MNQTGRAAGTINTKNLIGQQMKKNNHVANWLKLEI